MNKKLLVVSILAVFMLVAISFASAVSSNSTDEKRESPLFRVRTRRAIGERVDELRQIIRSRFVGDRLFFLPFQWLRNQKNEEHAEDRLVTGDKSVTCHKTNCGNQCSWDPACTVGWGCPSPTTTWCPFD